MSNLVSAVVIVAGFAAGVAVGRAVTNNAHAHSHTDIGRRPNPVDRNTTPNGWVDVRDWR